MNPVSLIDVASYLPEARVGAEFYADYPGFDPQLRNGPMFRAPAYRHHVAPDETAVDMVERAVAPLRERLGDAAVREVDVLLVHTQLPDCPVMGCGVEIARRLGCKPEWLLDVHNASCVSFVHMMKIARQLIARGDAKSALVCNVQNMAGQVFVQSEVRKLAQAAIPGDGCGVGYLTASNESPILAIDCVHIPEHAGEMGVTLDNERKYWEPGTSQMRLRFTEGNVADVIARGNRLVPEAVRRVCEKSGIAPSSIDALITNQPNRAFLRSWREALELPPERHMHTFEECGNLFGAAVPITLDRAIRSGQLRDGASLVLAGFSHVGDFAGAVALRWRAGG
ncbi:3-oxoacyl-ACP synthase III family protein [Pendulispora albinea]|uniref:3-oxoacyl-ACP synthase n=1 Tax=Pendulispora albinea TaxID=2741071 RepID=A0ABZ2MAY2_9BACT